jgi:hypothetical protein
MQVANTDDLQALYLAQRPQMLPRRRSGTNDADPVDRTAQSRPPLRV